MNKDVINVSPEDDITDVIGALKSASNKIVAIVPPKPASIFRSAINIRLIVKTAEEAGKIPVLVTTDPALLKFAMNFDLHVADSLTSKPYIPSDASAAEDSANPVAEEFVSDADEVSDVVLDEISEDIADDDASSTSVDEDESAEESSDKSPAQSSSEDDASDPEDDDPEARIRSKKQSKSKKSDLPSPFAQKFPWVAKHWKLLVFGGLGLVLLVAFLVWAFAFAPAVDISVSIRTTSNNFSESVTFTREQSAEDATSGKFYLHEEVLTDEPTVTFEATGKKDIGERAKGELSIATYFEYNKSEHSLTVPANSKFVYGDYAYLSTESNIIKWDGKTLSKCENSNINEISGVGCLISIKINIIAAEPGAKYDLAKGKSDWSVPDTVGVASAYNTTEISGGTTNVVTVVSQEDVDNARQKLSDTMTASEGKKKLLAKISDSMLILEDTFKAENSDSSVNVTVGEQVPEGTTPTATQKATFKVFTVDKVRIEEYITAKATLANDQKIYAIGNPFVEYFLESGDGYTGKLKTTYKVGPKVTEMDVLEKASGRKIGEVQSLLKSINGVSSVEIKKSYFWVSSVPTDPNKVSVSVTVEE